MTQLFGSQQENPFFKKQAPDYGRLDNFFDSAQDAFETGIGSMVTTGMRMAYEDSAAASDPSLQITQEEFDAQYSLGGLLKWRKGMSRATAEIMFKRRVEQEGRSYRLQNTGDRSKLVPLVGGFAGSMLHPIDLGLMVAMPELGVGKMIGPGKSLLTKAISSMGRGAIKATEEAALENLALYELNDYTQSGLTDSDYVMNLVFASGTGVGLGLGSRILGLDVDPRVSKLSKNELMDAVIRGKDGAGFWKILTADPNLADKAKAHKIMRGLLDKDVWDDGDRALAETWVEENYGLDLPRQERIKDRLDQNTYDQVFKESYEPVGEAETLIASVFKSVFGVDVRFHPELTSSGTIFPGAPTTLFIRRGTDWADLSMTAFHELTHSLRMRDPGTYRRVLQSITDNDIEIEIDGERKTLLEHARDDVMRRYGERWDKMSKVRQMDEIVAQAVGIAAKNPAFWRKLQRYHPNAFKRFVNYIKYIFDQFFDRLSDDEKALHTWKNLFEQIADAIATADPTLQRNLGPTDISIFSEVERQLASRNKTVDTKKAAEFAKALEEIERELEISDFDVIYPEERWEELEPVYRKGAKGEETIGNLSAYRKKFEKTRTVEESEAAGSSDSGLRVEFFYKGKLVPRSQKWGKVDTIRRFASRDQYGVNVEAEPLEIGSSVTRRAYKNTYKISEESKAKHKKSILKKYNEALYKLIAEKQRMDRAADQDAAVPGAKVNWSKERHTELLMRNNAWFFDQKTKLDRTYKALLEDREQVSVTPSSDFDTVIKERTKANAEGSDAYGIDEFGTERNVFYTEREYIDPETGQPVFEDATGATVMEDVATPDYTSDGNTPERAELKAKSAAALTKWRNEVIEPFLETYGYRKEALAAMTDDQIIELAFGVKYMGFPFTDVESSNKFDLSQLSGLRERLMQSKEFVAFLSDYTDTQPEALDTLTDAEFWEAYNHKAMKKPHKNAAYRKKAAELEAAWVDEQTRLDEQARLEKEALLEEQQSSDEFFSTTAEDAGLYEDSLDPDARFMERLSQEIDEQRDDMDSYDLPFLPQTQQYIARKAQALASGTKKYLDYNTSNLMASNQEIETMLQTNERDAAAAASHTIDQVHTDTLNQLPPPVRTFLDADIDLSAPVITPPAPLVGVAPDVVKFAESLRPLIDNTQVFVSNMYSPASGVFRVPLDNFDQFSIFIDDFVATKTSTKVPWKKERKVELFRDLRKIQATNTAGTFDTALQDYFRSDLKRRLTQAILQEKTVEKLNTFLGGKKPKERKSILKSFVDGITRRDGFRGLPLPHRKAATRQYYMQSILAVCAKYPGMYDDFITGRLDEQVVGYLTSDRTTKLPQNIQELADVIYNINEAQMGRLNRLGAGIRKLKGFAFNQSYRLTRRLKESDYNTWVDDTVAAIDWDATILAHGGIDKNGAPFDVAAFLRGLWEWERNEGWKDKYNRALDTGNVASQVSHSRFVHFKADKFAQWDKKYGSGLSAREILNNINRRSDNIALMESLGPNFDDTWDRVFASVGNKSWTLRSTFRQVTGQLDASVYESLSDKGKLIRQISNIIYMGGSGISALTDIPMIASTLRYYGVKVGTLESNVLARYKEAIQRTADKSSLTLRATGAGLEALGGNLSIRLAEDTASGRIGFLNNMMFHYNQLERMTTAGQEAVIQMMMQAMADGAVDPKLLDRFSISAADLDIIKNSARKVDGLSGKYSAPYMLDATHPVLAMKYRAFLDNVMKNGVVEPDPGAQALARLGLKAGTLHGEAVRIILQYSSFPLAVHRKVWARFINGYGDSFWKSFADPRARMVIDAMSFAASSFVMAYLVINLKDMANGREPIGMDEMNEENLKRILSQAGLSGSGFLDLFNKATSGEPIHALSAPLVGGMLDMGGAIFNDGNFAKASMNLTPGQSIPGAGEAMKNLFAYAVGDAWTEMARYNEARHKMREEKTGQSSIYQ